MIIHKTHSKSELVKIVELFYINISNPRQYIKINLSALIANHLDSIDSLSIDYDNPYYFTNIIDLKYYLINKNPKKILTIKQRNHVITICKKLKHYCKNNYNVNVSDYENIHQITSDVTYISKYGDIPSVRKTIRSINEDPIRIIKIKPIISEIVKKELDKKELYKRIGMHWGLEVKTGFFSLDFN